LLSFFWRHPASPQQRGLRHVTAFGSLRGLMHDGIVEWQALP